MGRLHPINKKTSKNLEKSLGLIIIQFN
jgi:hypothetical protein